MGPMAILIWVIAAVIILALFAWAWRLADKIDREEREFIERELRERLQREEQERLMQQTPQYYQYGQQQWATPPHQPPPGWR